MEIQDYIEKARKAGESDAAIKDALKNAGWQDSQIASHLPSLYALPREAGWYRKLGKKGHLILSLLAIAVAIVVGFRWDFEGAFAVIPVVVIMLVYDYQNWDKLVSKQTLLSDAERQYYRAGRMVVLNLLLPGLGTLKAGRKRLGYIQLSVFVGSLLLGFVFWVGFLVAAAMWVWALIVTAALRKQALKELESQSQGVSEYTKVKLAASEPMREFVKGWLVAALITLILFVVGIVVIVLSTGSKSEGGKKEAVGGGGQVTEESKQRFPTGPIKKIVGTNAGLVFQDGQWVRFEESRLKEIQDFISKTSVLDAYLGTDMSQRAWFYWKDDQDFNNPERVLILEPNGNLLIPEYKAPIEGGALASQPVLAVFDSQNRLFRLHGGGLTIHDVVKNERITFDNSDSPLTRPGTDAQIVADKEGRVWMAAGSTWHGEQGGLISYDAARNTLIPYKFDPTTGVFTETMKDDPGFIGTSQGFDFSDRMAIGKDAEGNLLVALSDVIQLSATTYRVEHFLLWHDESGWRGFRREMGTFSVARRLNTYDQVTSIADSGDAIWIGLGGAGYLKFDKASQAFDYISFWDNSELKETLGQPRATEDIVVIGDKVWFRHFVSFYDTRVIGYDLSTGTLSRVRFTELGFSQDNPGITFREFYVP